MVPHLLCSYNGIILFVFKGGDFNDGNGKWYEILLSKKVNKERRYENDEWKSSSIVRTNNKR
jgi:hypothetical protein